MNVSEILKMAQAGETTLFRNTRPIVTKVAADTVPTGEVLESRTIAALSDPVVNGVATLTTIDGHRDRNVPVPIRRFDAPGCDRFAVEGEARTEEELTAIHAAIHSSFAGFVAMAVIRVNVSGHIRTAIQAGAVFADFERYTLAAMPSSWEEKEATKGRRAGWYVSPKSPAGRYLSLVRTIMSELGMKKAPQTEEEKAAAKVNRQQAQIAALAKAGYKVEKVR